MELLAVSDVESNSHFIAYAAVPLARGRHRAAISFSDGRVSLCVHPGEDVQEMRRIVAEEKPGRVVVVGGGFIGLEAAENLVEAGVSVTLLQRSEQVMPPLDWDMACELHAELRKNGVDLRFKHAVERFEEVYMQKLTDEYTRGDDVKQDD